MNRNLALFAHRLAVLGSLALITMPVAASAQSAEQLAQADSNGDGSVSKQELMDLRADIFGKLDRNGDGFADSLRNLPQGRWSGPVQSGFGWHAVRVRDVVAAGTPPLSEIRQRVSNDWRAKTQATREAAAYQALLDGYDIRIAKP
jgi:hypothetical protein